MNVVIERCAGLDVHKKTVVACVRTPEGGRGKLRSRGTRTRTFATTMKGLEALRAWLGSHGVTAVAMESTGVYWRPVYAVLEGDFRLLPVNARHVKHVPAARRMSATASGSRSSYYRALYHRKKAKGGSKKAIVAVQHALLVAIWHMFSTGSIHQDLGPDHFQRHDKKRRVRYPKAQNEKLGVNIRIVDEAA